MTEKLSLYTIAEAFKKLEDMADDNSNSAITEYLDSVEMQLAEKASNVIKVTRHFELTAEAIDSEITRLSDLKKSFQNKADSLRNYISYSMQTNGIESVDTDIARLSFRKSKSVEVESIESLPEKFVITKVSKQADKKAIKEAIESGETVPGAHIQENKNLQIK